MDGALAAEPPPPALDAAPAAAGAFGAPGRPPGEPEAEPPIEPVVPTIDWERWIGVRGAAALGAGVLVIAGLYFFKYSVETGMLSPRIRVLLGTGAGLGCLGASELLLRRKYVSAHWLAGAGTAILFTTFWAARGLYELIGTWTAFGLMISVTAGCVLLSIRHASMAVAILGLLGGFITPFALSSGGDHPIGLFGYLLILDAALLSLAYRNRWPTLGALSLFGTWAYQVAWIGGRMRPDQFWIGIIVVSLFSALYAFGARPAPTDDEEVTVSRTQAVAILFPFLFGLYFGLRSDLGDRLVPVALMLGVLSTGACTLARVRRASWLAIAAAAGAVAVLGTWIFVHDAGAAAWDVTFAIALLAAVFHVFFELGEQPEGAWWKGGPRAHSPAAAVNTLGSLVVVAVAGAQRAAPDPWPWCGAVVLLSALLLRHDAFAEQGDGSTKTGPLAQAGALLGVGVLGAWLVARDPGLAIVPVGLAIALLAAAFHGVLEIAARRPEGARRPDVIGLSRAAGINAVGSMVLVVLVSAWPSSWDPKPWFAGLMFLAGLALRNASLSAGSPAWIATASAGASAVAAGCWIAAHDPVGRRNEVIALVCLLAGVFHAFVELGERWPAPRREGSGVPRGGAVSSLGLLFVLFAAGTAPSSTSPWPWVGGAAVLSALTLRNAGFEGRAPLHLGVAIGLGLGLPLLHLAHGKEPGFVSPDAYLGLTLAAALALQGIAHARRSSAGAPWSARAAAVLPLLLLLEPLAFPHAAKPALVVGVTVAFGALALGSATRLGSAAWAIVAMLAAAIAQGVWAELATPALAPLAFAGLGLSAVMFAVWPLVMAPRSGESVWIWAVGALAGPVFFFPLRIAFVGAFGAGAIGAVPVALAALTFGVGLRARTAVDPASPVRRTALVWLFGTAVAFTSIAVPMQLENEWITVGWAILGLALVAVWRRFDHAGLKYVALAHLAVVTLRLVGNPAVLDYHPRPPTPIFNWLLYTYGVPALCLAGAWYLLRALEVERVRAWERGLYGRGLPLAAMGAMLAALVIGFVWLNLSIINAFATGPALELTFEHQPVRDLALSIAWAVYALTLLAVGMVRGSAGLRWVSLALILVTVGKVFLYDLSHLRDLYRVASLVGLAFSLIFISLAYQRFVFRKDSPRPS